ncbi:MAG: DUF805 domain-containing protein [Verrucomicrobiae bacterium]|nr:DUF805 domain-containing protein [Verrucomicrobiae bacterium]NNJ42793.1 DUF805 domain-containing protein [Akkermansiaceae bacterium]
MEAPQQWYFVDGDGKQAGPVTRDNLQGKITSGVVVDETLVWSEGMAEWQAASSVDGLMNVPTPQAEPAAVAQVGSGSSLASSASSAVNPYTAPQSDLGVGAGVQAKPGFMATLFSFGGRIPRRTYWAYSFILMGIVMAVLVAPIMLLGEESPVTLIIVAVVYVGMIWSSLALQCKRWHDRGKSGWWFLIGLVPLIGGIWSFIEVGCLRGTMGPNDYGDDPT